MFDNLPKEVKEANALIVRTQEEVRQYRALIKEVEAKPEYLKALEVLRAKGQELRDKLQAEIQEKLALVKALKPKRATGNGQKAPYTFKVEGNGVVVNSLVKGFEGKTLSIPSADVKYSTELIGNSKGATGKIAVLGLSFQQGKSLVGAINGK